MIAYEDAQSIQERAWLRIFFGKEEGNSGYGNDEGDYYLQSISSCINAMDGENSSSANIPDDEVAESQRCPAQEAK